METGSEYPVGTHKIKCSAIFSSSAKLKRGEWNMKKARNASRFTINSKLFADILKIYIFFHYLD